MWPKIYGHSNIFSHVWVLTFHSKPWASTYCYKSLYSSGKAFHKILWLGWRDLLAFSLKSIIEVSHWCWVIRPSSKSVFRFIPKVLDGVEVSQVLPYQTLKTLPLRTWLCAQRYCVVERVKDLPQTVGGFVYAVALRFLLTRVHILLAIYLIEFAVKNNLLQRLFKTLHCQLPKR